MNGPAANAVAFAIFVLTCVTCGAPHADPDAPIVQRVPGVQFMGCRQASVNDLWTNPWRYAHKRVCVTGHLVKMVPYGEESVELVATRVRAHEKKVNQYLDLSVPLTMSNQIELSHFSEMKVHAVGKFEFDPRCWPNRKTGEESKYVCTSLMRLDDATLSQ